MRKDDKRERPGVFMTGEWNHFDKYGNAVMVDVSGKEVTVRTASAT